MSVSKELFKSKFQSNISDIKLFYQNQYPAGLSSNLSGLVIYETKYFFHIDIKICSTYIRYFLEPQWKWLIYRVWLVEYKDQLATFAVNAIKKSKWLFSLQDQVLTFGFVR